MDGCWVLGGAGGADRLQAELRAGCRYGTGAASQPCRALALPAKISARVSDDGAMRECGLNRKIIGGTHRNPMEEASIEGTPLTPVEKNGRAA